MDVDRLWPFQLTRGHSKDPTKGACLLDAVSWFEDGCLNDKPQCVSPVLARLGHFANDILADGPRQQLRRFIPRLVGTVDERADELRAEYVLFTCESFAKRWDGSPMNYYALSTYLLFWDNATAPVRDRHLSPGERVFALTSRLMQAAHTCAGVHQWIDHSEMPSIRSFLPDCETPATSAIVKVNRISAQEDVERIAIDLLDVCCAIGAPQAEWDFSRVPAAVKRFQKAREAV